MTRFQVFAINSIHFHPVYGTFATAGSDGRFVFWDKDSKSRLREFKQLPNPLPITCGRFSPDGNIYVYAQSYDWHKGAGFYPGPGHDQIRVRA